jgi:hypothetical protein
VAAFHFLHAISCFERNNDVTRHVVLGRALVLALSGFSGCGTKEKGVKNAGSGVSKETAEQETIQAKVNNVVSRLTNGPDGQAGKRLSAARTAARMAADPALTSDLKASLIAALEKMIMNEPMSEADEASKTEIAEEGQKALQALKGG